MVVAEKGGKPKQQRAKQTKLPPDNYTLRPGLLPTGGGGIVNAGEIVNIDAIVNLTTQSTMPAPQSGSAIPVTCTTVNISTSPLPISNPPRNDVHPPPVSTGLPPHIKQRQSILLQTSLLQHQGMVKGAGKPLAS